MQTICGADCAECSLFGQCNGCEATCGRPFGGDCIAAKYILSYGRELYSQFKQNLLLEINAILSKMGYDPLETLFELHGSFINLPYPLPNGKTAKFLDDRNIYLGGQSRIIGSERFIGVTADADFIIVSTYGPNGSDPHLLLYKHRMHEE